MANISEVAVIWSVGILAIAIAVNARGVVRVVLSWFLASGVIGLAVVVSTLNMDVLRQKFLDGDVLSTAAINAPNPTLTASSGSVVEVAPANSAPSSSKAYLKNVDPLVVAALSCARSVSEFDMSSLANIPDTQYEQYQSKALSLRNQAANIDRQIKSLQPPSELATLHSSLQKASESLRLAGWAVHAYFGAENESEEKNYQDQFQKYSQSALAEFKAIQNELQNVH